MQNVRVADSQESCLADLAVISSKFLIPYRGVGILAIIGPVNLDYQQLINQVNVVNRVLTMKLTDFYRYLSSNPLRSTLKIEIIKGGENGPRYKK